MSQLETPCQSPESSHYSDISQQHPSQHTTIVLPTLTSTITKAQASWKKLFTTAKTKNPEVSRTTTLNTINGRENTVWGDEIQAKEPDTTRIYSINL